MTKERMFLKKRLSDGSFIMFIDIDLTLTKLQNSYYTRDYWNYRITITRINSYYFHYNVLLVDIDDRWWVWRKVELG